MLCYLSAQWNNDRVQYACREFLFRWLLVSAILDPSRGNAYTYEKEQCTFTSLILLFPCWSSYLLLTTSFDLGLLHRDDDNVVDL